MNKINISARFPYARFFEEDGQIALHFGCDQIIRHVKNHAYRVSYVERQDAQFEITNQCVVVPCKLSDVRNGEFFFDTYSPSPKLMIDNKKINVLSIWGMDIYEAGYTTEDVNFSVFKVKWVK